MSEPCYLHIFPRRSPVLNSYFADKAVASVFGALLAQSMGDIGFWSRVSLIDLYMCKAWPDLYSTANKAAAVVFFWNDDSW